MNRKENKKHLVSICCPAYNHENYIEQAIKSFLMQKTDFNYEIIINDDASTDNTALIIASYAEKYPYLIKAIYQQENQYSKGNKPFNNVLFPLSRGKYVAVCEGDDYWTDPYKLQKQVDFLEANPEYVAVAHPTYISYENKTYTSNKRLYFRPKPLVTKKQLIQGHQFHLNSLLFRNIKEEMKNWNMYVFTDIALGIMLSQYGKIGALQDTMSIYRKHDTGQTGIMKKKLDKAFDAQIKMLEGLKQELGPKFFWGYHYKKALRYENYYLNRKKLSWHSKWIKLKYYIILSFLTLIICPRNLKTRIRLLKYYIGIADSSK